MHQKTFFFQNICYNNSSDDERYRLSALLFFAEKGRAMKKWGNVLAAILVIHLIVIVVGLLVKDWLAESDQAGNLAVSGLAECTAQNMELLADMGQRIMFAGGLGAKNPQDGAADEKNSGDANGAEAIDTLWYADLTEAELLERGKVIYLTFDDGPSAYTEELLEILARYGVKATFFVTGGYEPYFDMIGRAKEEGHTIGIHCYRHDYKQVYASEEAYFADLQKIDDIIYEQTGERAKLVRFPGGSSNISSKFNPGIMTRLTALVEEKGYRYYDWNVLSGDAGDTEDTDQIVENVIEGVKKKGIAVVLQHDSHQYSVDAVERIIIWGLENGYAFLPLSVDSPIIHHTVAN